LPHLVELAERYADRPVAVVSIDGGIRSEAASDFLDENKVRHLVLNDEERTAFNAYGVSGVPTTVIIDHAGRLMFRHVGFAPGMEKRFAQEIETLLGWIEEA
jgi:protein-disulfide isomerase-like protein with CxxC motif